MMHAQDLQHLSSTQQQLSQEHDAYSQDVIQVQQQLYTHADNSSNSMLGDLLSIPQDMLASTIATAAATCAAAGGGENESLARANAVYHG